MSWVHEVERVDWFIFQNNTCQSKSVLLGGAGGGFTRLHRSAMESDWMNQRLTAPQQDNKSLLAVIRGRTRTEKSGSDRWSIQMFHFQWGKAAIWHM